MNTARLHDDFKMKTKKIP